MLELLNGFVVELRNAGLPVSLTENLDAMEAVQHIPIDDREAFKYALGATLIKNQAHWRSFETIFEVYFSLRGPEYKLVDGDEESMVDDLWREMQDQQQGQEGQGGAGGLENLTPEEIAQMLMSALMNGDQGMMRAMARQAVQRFAGMEPGRPVGGTYYLYRTLRNLDLDSMLDRLMESTREEVGDGSGLSLRLEVNGDCRQQGSTSQMQHGVADLVAHVSPTELTLRDIFRVPGAILESRLIGNILYVISRDSWRVETTDQDGVVHVLNRSGLPSPRSTSMIPKTRSSITP